MSHLDKARLVLLTAIRAHRLTALFVVVVAVSISTHAGAAEVDWTLSDVTFTAPDTGTATGSFTFDANPPSGPPPALTGGSISVTGGGISDFTYTLPPVFSPFPVDPSLLSACDFDPNGMRCIFFQLLTPMTDVGGTVTIAIDSSFSLEFAGFNGGDPQVRQIESGCFTTTGFCATVVSEPSTLLLLGSGLAGVAATLRMRFRRRV
jgi:hypothetical protein